jgi:hypothetical protein
VLPTFGNVAASFHMTEPPEVKFPGIDIELGKVLHASEAVTVPGPLPPSGTARSVQRFTEIWDKGKAAVIVSESTVTDPDSKVLWTTKRSIFARGEGASAASAARRPRWPPGSRAGLRDRRAGASAAGAAVPALRRPQPTALDPGFAAAAGFDRPILHGLCTYGMTCKALVDTLLDADVTRVGGWARFAGVVFPGETIRVSAWKDGDRYIGVVTAPSRDDAVVLSDVELTPV